MIVKPRHLTSERRAPTAHLAARSVGVGVHEFASGGSSGRVVGTFSHGFYIGRRSELVAVVDTSVALGPLHLNVDTEFHPPTLGSVAHVDADTINVDGLQVDVSSGQTYRPTLPAGLASGANVLARMSAGVPEDLEVVWPAIRARVADRDLLTLRELLAGRGRGLTPEGDDVLAGMFIVLAANESRRPSLAALVEGAATTDLSKAFLRWAARGQTIDVVHDLLWAAHRHDVRVASIAQRRLSTIGGSTGAAMWTGMKLAASLWKADSRGARLLRSEC